MYVESKRVGDQINNANFTFSFPIRLRRVVEMVCWAFMIRAEVRRGSPVKPKLQRGSDRLRGDFWY